MKYTLCGQDARTTRVLLLISVLHNIGNCCILVISRPVTYLKTNYLKTINYNGFVGCLIILANPSPFVRSQKCQTLTLYNTTILEYIKFCNEIQHFCAVMYQYQDFIIRNWQESDRTLASQVISSVLLEYGLPWQPEEADKDVLQIEAYYLKTGGEFWVIEQENQIVGTAAYYPINRGEKAVEIRKMYLLPKVRGLGLGKFLLQQLETVISAGGFEQIWIETASILTEAVKLYESNGYLPTTGVETTRCDLVYVKYLR